MSVDRTQRAVDEAALARVITAGWKHVKRDGSPLALARHILRSGALLDVDEVRREADTQRGLAAARAKVAERKYAELRAAIQALGEKWRDRRDQTNYAIEAGAIDECSDDLHALLADDGAALREVKHAVWLEAVQAVAWAMDNGPQDDALRYVAEHSPYDYDRRRAEAEDGHLDALMHEEAGDGK